MTLVHRRPSRRVWFTGAKAAAPAWRNERVTRTRAIPPLRPAATSKTIGDGNREAQPKGSIANQPRAETKANKKGSQLNATASPAQDQRAGLQLEETVLSPRLPNSRGIQNLIHPQGGLVWMAYRGPARGVHSKFPSRTDPPQDYGPGFRFGARDV